jgi:probable FeS assembly SUF system protein SufT
VSPARVPLSSGDCGLIWDKRPRAAGGIIDNQGSTHGRARRYRIGVGMSGFSLSSEPFTLMRDCSAVLVPQGDVVTLPAGQIGYITQALGGSFTVYVEGNLFRIAGDDADALGKERPAPIEVPDDATNADVEKLAWDQLRTVFDPEIPVNVVELGLVYDLSLEQTESGERKVYVKLTLTAPGCGMGDILVDDARTKLEMIPTVVEADVDLVFDPPWTHSMMSDAAKLETGML